MEIQHGLSLLVCYSCAANLTLHFGCDTINDACEDLGVLGDLVCSYRWPQQFFIAQIATLVDYVLAYLANAHSPSWTVEDIEFTWGVLHAAMHGWIRGISCWALVVPQHMVHSGNM